MALKWDQSERSQNFRYKVTAVFVRGLFSKFFPRCGERWQMRCRLILLITEHPIQQGIRKGGVRHFCDGRGRTRTDEDRMAYSRKWDCYHNVLYWVAISYSESDTWFSGLNTFTRSNTLSFYIEDHCPHKMSHHKNHYHPPEIIHTLSFCIEEWYTNNESTIKSIFIHSRVYKISWFSP